VKNKHGVILGGQDQVLIDRGNDCRAVVTVAEHDGLWYFGAAVDYGGTRTMAGGFGFAPSQNWDDEVLSRGYDSAEHASLAAKRYIARSLRATIEIAPQLEPFIRPIILACELRLLFSQPCAPLPRPRSRP